MNSINFKRALVFISPGKKYYAYRKFLADLGQNGFDFFKKNVYTRIIREDSVDKLNALLVDLCPDSVNIEVILTTESEFAGRMMILKGVSILNWFASREHGKMEADDL